jgi:hypothetical protein
MRSPYTVVNTEHRYLRGRGLKNARAALRALTGARLLASGQAPNAVVAAACTGSSPTHVRAAVVVLKSEDESLLNCVLGGDMSLLAAAKMARRVAKLVSAYRGADEDDLTIAAKIIGRVLVPTAAAAE